MGNPENYKNQLQDNLENLLRERGDVLSANDIAEMLKRDHEWNDDEYIGGREKDAPRCIHVPDLTGTALPGKAHPVEEYFRGEPKQLLIQRLHITTERAEEVMELFEKEGFKITP